jgi:cell division septation protein DedD
MPVAGIRPAPAYASMPLVTVAETPDLSFQSLSVEDELPDYLDTQPLDEKKSTADQDYFFTDDQEPPSMPPPEQRFDWMGPSQPLEAPQEYLRADSSNSQPLKVTFKEASPALAPQPQAAMIEVSESENLPATVPADPWEDPLPAWETSRNEYPVLMHAEGKQRMKVRSVFLVALLVISLAAFYIVVWSPFGQAPSKTVARPEGPKASQPESKAGQTAATNNPPAATPPEVTRTAQPQQQPAPPTQTLSVPAGQGTISLQAMSSPNEAEAKEFAEKLTRAGISAYVVAADLKAKGRWYRVRVGRFGTREEAARYAEQSKARARAAGLKLNLITVDEKS